MKYRMIWTEEVKTCACCGREELKGTFRIDLPGGAQFFGQTCAKKQGYNSEEIKIAKSKLNKEYNQIGFINDSRQKELNEQISKTSIRDRVTIAKLSNKLREIREEYRIK